MYRHNHDSPAKRGAVVIKKPWLLNGQVDHSSLSLRSLRLSCELWGPCCHHLPRQPLDAVLKPEPALDITCLDVPAPVTAQLEQTKVLRDWLYADTVVHILIQIITQFYSVKITHLPKCPCFQYLRQSSKVNVKGTRYYINFIMFSDLYFKISFDILRILLYQWSWKKDHKNDLIPVCWQRWAARPPWVPSPGRVWQARYKTRQDGPCYCCPPQI